MLASDSMISVVAHGPRDYRLETLPIPSYGHNEMLVRVLHVGVCASDIKMYNGADIYWAKGGRAKAGVIPGHEFVCRVVAIGLGAAERYADISVRD